MRCAPVRHPEGLDDDGGLVQPTSLGAMPPPVSDLEWDAMRDVAGCVTLGEHVDLDDDDLDEITYERPRV